MIREFAFKKKKKHSFCRLANRDTRCIGVCREGFLEEKHLVEALKDE